VKSLEQKLKESETKRETLEHAFVNYKKMVQETFFDAESGSDR
jgi:hypothetical protein